MSVSEIVDWSVNVYSSSDWLRLDTCPRNFSFTVQLVTLLVFILEI